MSENLENQTTETTVESNSQPVQKEENSKDAVNKAEKTNEDNFKNILSLINQIASKRDEMKQDLIARRDYLNKIVPQYDSEDYFKNDSFKELYSEIFNHAGARLDMERFIPLLDKYVEARIEANTRKNSAKKENENLTDGMAFSSGESKKSEKKLRMQDIPAEELEKYIAKYL